MWEIERAYTDILSRLTGREKPWSYGELRDAVEAVEPVESQFASTATNRTTRSHPGWTPLHDECLHYLKGRGRAVETDEGIDISEPDEQYQSVVPQHEPLRTVYEYGPIDGCKDYAVYSMVSWCELIDLDWQQTKAFVVHWLQESGRWDDESWGEASPQQLVQSKQHIHEKGLGWGDYPEMAKTEMETSAAEPRLDAGTQASVIDRELLSSMSV